MEATTQCLRKPKRAVIVCSREPDVVDAKRMEVLMDYIRMIGTIEATKIERGETTAAEARQEIRCRVADEDSLHDLTYKQADELLYAGFEAAGVLRKK
jgi:hypothetical protein